MKRNLLRPLTRPVRSPLHSSRCVRSGLKPDISSVGPLNHDYFALSDDIDLK
jgi:hypothetical protein